MVISTIKMEIMAMLVVTTELSFQVLLYIKHEHFVDLWHRYLLKYAAVGGCDYNFGRECN